MAAGDEEAGKHSPAAHQCGKEIEGAGDEDDRRAGSMDA